LEKRQRKFIRAIHETVPFTNAEEIKAGLENPASVQLGKADFIIEVAANKFSELENVKKEFESHLPPTIASLSTA